MSEIIEGRGEEEVEIQRGREGDSNKERYDLTLNAQTG